MRFRLLLSLAAFLLATVAPAGAAEKAPDAAALAKEGVSLYREGSFAEAMKKLDAAIAAGTQDPEVFFMAGESAKRALSNAAREKELKQRAVPLLESRLAKGGSLSDHYYLASIEVETLGDKAKGAEVARKGVAAVDASKGAALKAPMDRFMLGRLNTFAGNDDRAAAQFAEYVKAAGKPGEGADASAYKTALEFVAAHQLAAKQYAAAADSYAALLEVDPGNDQIRNIAARSRLLSGDPLKAAAIWRGAKSDEMRTEFMYFSNVATRFAKAGSPGSSALAPNAASLSDQELVEKIRQAGQKFGQIRTAWMTEKKSKEDAARSEVEAKREEKRNLSPEEVKERVAARKKELKGELAGSDEDPNEPMWERMEKRNLEDMTATADVPEPPEMKAAAKDFYFLMVEYVKRGHMLRDFSFQYGLMDLIFR